ncbi:unnamed protein product [Leuciscus chuanchicus]
MDIDTVVGERDPSAADQWMREVLKRRVSFPGNYSSKGRNMFHHKRLDLSATSAQPVSPPSSISINPAVEAHDDINIIDFATSCLHLGTLYSFDERNRMHYRKTIDCQTIECLSES